MSRCTTHCTVARQIRPAAAAADDADAFGQASRVVRFALLPLVCFLFAPFSIAFGAEEYVNDGVLDARSEETRWQINRTRFAPEREADRLGLVNTRPGSNGNFDVAEDTDGVDDFTSTVPGNSYGWADWKVSRAPYAPNAKLSSAAQKHGMDLRETQKFQHESPSSRYFPVGSSPVQRHAVEGYTNVGYGYIENLLSSGIGFSDTYPDESITPVESHESLFIDEGIIDRGHRKTILNFVCTEIGLGFVQDRRIRRFDGVNYFFTTDYYTYDVGLRSGQHFFTGSIFHDVNGNELYDRGEGVEGVEVRLYQGGYENAYYDRSEVEGSFAVPINSLVEGEDVAVALVNTANSPVTISIPVTYDTVGEVTLAAGATLQLGSFIQPASELNTGFRDVQPNIDLAINCSVEHVSISFSALIGLTYEVQAATDLVIQNWESVEIVTATENIVSIACGDNGEPLPSGSAFRVVWLRNLN